MTYLGLASWGWCSSYTPQQYPGWGQAVPACTAASAVWLGHLVSKYPPHRCKIYNTCTSATQVKAAPQLQQIGTCFTWEKKLPLLLEVICAKTSEPLASLCSPRCPNRVCRRRVEGESIKAKIKWKNGYQGRSALGVQKLMSAADGWELSGPCQSNVSTFNQRKSTPQLGKPCDGNDNPLCDQLLHLGRHPPFYTTPLPTLSTS